MNKVFPRRRNPDGSIDSICTKCFRTIASRATEAHLAEEEKRHSCQAPDLHRAETKPTGQRRRERPSAK